MTRPSKIYITERKLKVWWRKLKNSANIVYAARCKVSGEIYIGNTGKELRERFSKHRHDAKKRPENNELAAHIHKYQHEFDMDIDVLILKRNLHQKLERELREVKSTCSLSTKAPRRLIIEIETLQMWALWSLHRPHCIKYGTFT